MARTASNVICNEHLKDGSLQKFQEGSHELKMVGTIPGTDVRIESNTVTVDLYCNPTPAEEESGCSAAGGAPFALSLLILGALRRRRRII